MDVLYSSQDDSVNFVDWKPDGGAFECRYVRRPSTDYMIAYLSSHTGCSKACRMCHLTQTGQTMMLPADLGDFAVQAGTVLDYYRDQPKADRVNFNFMARGEPMANPTITENWSLVAATLRMNARMAGISNVKYNISTIMPSEAENMDLATVFDEPDTYLYYSLYSMRETFRKRWLPKALNPDDALDKLANWQQATGKILALHWAFIAGENDDLSTLDEIIAAVKARGIEAKFNAVRYNPYSERQGVEPSEEIVERNFNYLADALGSDHSRIVPRVGRDCYASCGMFIE